MSIWPKNGRKCGQNAFLGLGRGEKGYELIFDEKSQFGRKCGQNAFLGLGRG